MALHTQAEFCKMLGISKDYLKSYKRRGKVVLKDGKYIDDTHPINLAFMQSRKPKKNTNLEKPDTEIKVLAPREVVLSENGSQKSGEGSRDVRNLTYEKLVKEEKAEKILKTRDEEKEKRTIFVGNLPNDSKKEVS